MAGLKSKDVYRAASAILRPWALANGFVGPRDSRRPGPWTGEWSGIHVAFELQVDKWGWFEESGSKFTINFAAHLPTGTYRMRYGRLLRRRPSPEELAMAWSLNCVTNVPGAHSTGTSREPDFAETDRAAFASMSERVLAKIPADAEFRDLDTTLGGGSTDPWMRFWDAADVVEWMSAFIIPRLPRLLDALALGEPKPMPTPVLALASLAVAVEGGCLVLRLSKPDARRLGEVLRVPWAMVTIEGPTRVVALVQTGAVRGPIGVVDASSRKITWDLGRSTRGVLIEMLEAAPLGQPRAVEDRYGNARFDTGVMLEVHA